RVGDWRMRVLGVLAESGTRVGLNVDELALVPVGTGMRLFDRSSLFRILMDVSAHADMERVRRRAVEVLRKRHDGEEDVTVLTQESVLAAFSDILSVLTLAVAAVGGISLFVAGVGIMNVMLVSVSERTAEVGLLKALGATHRQVLAVFLAEAVILSSSGALCGLLVAGAAVAAVGWAFPSFAPSPPAWALAASLGVASASGALFGVLPARAASRLDPVEALRGGRG
ncbi:MAG: FtsX-like permease family protein, partial [Planctomycetota bacterium]